MQAFLNRSFAPLLNPNESPLEQVKSSIILKKGVYILLKRVYIGAFRKKESLAFEFRDLSRIFHKQDEAVILFKSKVLMNSYITSINSIVSIVQKLIILLRRDLNNAVYLSLLKGKVKSNRLLKLMRYVSGNIQQHYFNFQLIYKIGRLLTI